MPIHSIILNISCHLQHESKQAAELLTKWEPIGTEDVLELLSAEFKSAHVRRHAVASLTLVRTNTLLMYLQLTATGQ